MKNLLLVTFPGNGGFLIFMIDILCQIRDNMAKSGITWPYKIEKGQIQKTSSSNQWYPVKFSFSSGDQWVNSAFHRFWKRFIIFSSAKRCNFFSKIWNGLAIAFTNKSNFFFIFPTLNNAAIILFSDILQFDSSNHSTTTFRRS